MNYTLAAGLLCLMFGVWCLYVALGAREKRVAVLRNCVQVRGRVVRLKDVSTEGDSYTFWEATVAYKAKNGETFELKLSPESEPVKFRVGTTVTVYYESGSPDNATTARRLWDVNLACALSFVPVLLGFGFLYTVYQDAAQESRPKADAAAASPAPEAGALRSE